MPIFAFEYLPTWYVISTFMYYETLEEVHIESNQVRRLQPHQGRDKRVSPGTQHPRSTCPSRTRTSRSSKTSTWRSRDEPTRFSRKTGHHSREIKPIIFMGSGGLFFAKIGAFSKNLGRLKAREVKILGKFWLCPTGTIGPSKELPKQIQIQPVLGETCSSFQPYLWFITQKWSKNLKRALPSNTCLDVDTKVALWRNLCLFWIISSHYNPYLICATEREEIQAKLAFESLLICAI